jgi:protocatechuate 3,4-dioxygenase beta subunit
MSRRSVLVFFALVFALASVVVARDAQMVITNEGVARAAPPPAGTGLILGRVIEDGSNRPIAGAVVTASIEVPGGSSNYEPVMTDDSGRFVLRDMGAVRVAVRATKAGYITGYVGRASPEDWLAPALQLRLSENARIDDLTIAMWRHATIAGTVTDESGEPIVGASVRALPRRIIGGHPRFSLGVEAMGGAASTDDRGAYRIGGLPPGDYAVAVPVVTVTSPKSAFRAPPAPGRGRSGSLASSQWLTPGVSGGGGGSGGIDVGHERVTLNVRTARSFGGDAGGFAGITPDGRLLSWETQFHPGTPLLSRAGVVTVTSGEERRGIDFRMRALPTSSVSGVLTGPDGPAPNVLLRLVHAETALMSHDPEIAQATSDRDGRFSFLGVPPGQYLVRTLVLPQVTRRMTTGGTAVQTGQGGGGGGVVMFSGAGGLSSDEPTLWAESPVSVGDRDVDDIAIALRPGARLSGRIVFDGQAPRPAMVNMPLVAVDPVRGAALNTSWYTGRIDAELRVQTYGVPPGRYFVRVPFPVPGWRLKSVMSGGRDVSVVPIEIGTGDVTDLVITMTDSPISELSGRVTNARGEPETSATVLVFPGRPESWTDTGTTPRNFKAIRVTYDARFEIADLPPGDYSIAAVVRPSAVWASPDSLRQLSPGATRLTIADGDRKTIDLRVTRTGSPGVAIPSDVPVPLALRHEDAADVAPNNCSACAVDGSAVTAAGPLSPSRRETVQNRPVPLRDTQAGPFAGVAGVVVSDEATPKPIKRAVVMAGGQTTITDEEGRFALPGLTPGRVVINASKPAYISTQYGATRPGGPGTPIMLAAGQQMTGVTLRLARGAVITGLIRDERGQPAPELYVRLYRYRYVNGERRLDGVPIGPVASTMTDDRGIYRLFGLPPGEYYIGAEPRTAVESMRVTTEAEVQAARRELTSSTASGGVATAARAGSINAASRTSQTVAYSVVLYPGVTDASQARAVRVAAGEERTGIDMSLRLVPTATVEAIVTSPTGSLPSNVEARLVRVDEGVLGTGGILTMLPTRPDAQGRLAFAGVRPGSYAVVAYSAGPPTSVVGATGNVSREPGGVSYWAHADVTVTGSDVTGIALVLQPGLTVSGSVRFDGGAAANQPAASQPSPEALRVSLLPVLSGAQISVGSPRAVVDAQGHFQIAGITPGRYRISVTGGPAAANSGWILRSAMAGSVDAVDVPFDVRPGVDGHVVVTFTNRFTELSGTLQSLEGHAAPDYFVVLLPADRAMWPFGLRTRQTRPSTDGRFTFQRIRPGDYFIAALTDLDSSQLQDPDFLEQLVPAAVRVSVGEGEKKVQDIRIAGSGG